MMNTIAFLAPPIAMAVLLVLIHAYLGMHVLERGVIFVDISLSQVAALGGTISMFFFHENEVASVAFSLGLCLLAALLLAILHRFEKKISQEVLIGITYAFATGSLILVADKLPHGAEQIKQALIGNILFVTWPHVLETFGIYAFIGLLHYIFRKQFWLASQGKLDSFFWDFFFYLLFGVVITFSTHHAGVLVVFSILIVPSALALRLAEGFRKRLFMSWLVGLVGILVSFLLSFKLDLPTGAGIVTTLTLGFFLLLTAKLALEQARK